MNEKLNKIRQEKRTAQIMVAVCAAGLAVSLILTLRRSPFAFVFYGLILLFYLFVFRNQSKRYQQAVKNATLEECLRPFLKNISYQEKDGLDPKAILNAGFIPIEHENSLLIRDIVHGSYQAMPVFLSDVTSDYVSAKSTKRGNEKPVFDFLSGNWFEICFKESFPFSCTIWDKELVSDSAREHFFNGFYSADSSQNAEFRNRFCTYTKDRPDITLPDELTRALPKLAEFTPGKIAVQLDGQHFRIFIRNRFLYTNTVSPKIDITPQILQHNQYPEISYILRAADAAHQNL